MASADCQPLTSIEQRAVSGEEHLLLNESLYDIPNPAMTYCTFFDKETPTTTTTQPLSPTPVLPPPEFKVTVAESQVVLEPSGVSTFVAEKPVIADVKIFRPEVTSKRFLSPTPEVTSKKENSWSAEAINRLDILSDLADDNLHFRLRNRTSTFTNPSNPHAQQSVYIDLGEYQTLLGHGRLDEEEGEEQEHEGEQGERDGLGGYSLPQPLGYGDDTLKAVQEVTQKFDSFRLRQMRVRSFRESGIYSRRRSSNCSVLGKRESGASIGMEEDFSRRVSSLNHPPSGGELTERDVYRIEVFYKGGGAEVCVCRSLADVFVGAGAAKQNDDPHQWIHIHTGVPVLLLNTGEGVRPRELVVLVAQRDTALPLWQDKVSYLSNYRESSPGVHSMNVSGSLSKSVQLRMEDPVAAKSFLDRFHEMTSDSDDELWKISADPKIKVKVKVKDKDTHHRTEKKRKQQQRKRSVTKADISHPCNSTRLTRVDAKDRNFRSAFGDVLPAFKEFIKSTGTENEATDEGFRPRLPTN